MLIKVTVKVLVYSLVPGYACSHNFTPWLDPYNPAPSPLPGEHYTAAIIGAG